MDKLIMGRRTVLAGAGLGAAAALAGRATEARAVTDPSTTRAQYVEAEVQARYGETDRTYQALSASDLNPSGFYLPPDTALDVVVARATAETHQIVIGAPDAEIDEDKRTPRVHDLEQGRQTITDPYGGPIYWKVIGESGHLRAFLGRQAQPMPFFVHGETSESDFRRQLATRTTPYVEFVSAHALVTVQREAAMRFRGQPHQQLMDTFEEIIGIEDAVSGWDGSSPLHARLAHRFHFVTRAAGIEGVGAFATHGHMLFPAPIQDRLLTVNALRLRGWGPYHELGHQHQQTPYKPGSLTEVTCNIYSLAVNKEFAKYGQLPRMHVPERNGLTLWESATPKIGQSGLDFLDDVTTMEKLVLFEQLRLGFGEDYYPRLHKLVREEKPDAGSYSDNGYRLGMLALYTSKAADRDLRGFYAKWGLSYDAEFDDRIAALGLPEPERDLTAIRDEEGRATARRLGG